MYWCHGGGGDGLAQRTWWWSPFPGTIERGNVPSRNRTSELGPTTRHCSPTPTVATWAAERLFTWIFPLIASQSSQSHESVLRCSQVKRGSERLRSGFAQVVAILGCWQSRRTFPPAFPFYRICPIDYFAIYWTLRTFIVQYWNTVLSHHRTAHVASWPEILQGFQSQALTPLAPNTYPHAAHVAAPVVLRPYHRQIYHDRNSLRKSRSVGTRL